MYMLFRALNILLNNHSDPMFNILDGIFFYELMRRQAIHFWKANNLIFSLAVISLILEIFWFKHILFTDILHIQQKGLGVAIVQLCPLPT